MYKMNICNKLFKYDRQYEVHVARNDAKINEVYVDWNKSNKENPTEYLNKLLTYKIEDCIVYYWICEDDLNKLTETQLERMHFIGLEYFNYL